MYRASEIINIYSLDFSLLIFNILLKLLLINILKNKLYLYNEKYIFIFISFVEVNQQKYNQFLLFF